MKLAMRAAVVRAGPVGCKCLRHTCALSIDIFSFHSTTQGICTAQLDKINLTTLFSHGVDPGSIRAGAWMSSLPRLADASHRRLRLQMSLGQGILSGTHLYLTWAHPPR